jgi:hypothetical protein
LESITRALEAREMGSSERESLAWQALARSMFRLNEFVYLD